MYGIFVNERGAGRYATWLANGSKTIETRSRDMLRKLVGKRVAIVKTHRNTVPFCGPVVIGYVTITREWFCPAADFQQYFRQHLVQPGTAYDASGRGKWFYFCADAEMCEPYPLPRDAVRHGRSWCEF